MMITTSCGKFQSTNKVAYENIVTPRQKEDIKT